MGVIAIFCGVALAVGFAIKHLPRPSRHPHSIYYQRKGRRE